MLYDSGSSITTFGGFELVYPEATLVIVTGESTWPFLIEAKPTWVTVVIPTEVLATPTLTIPTWGSSISILTEVPERISYGEVLPMPILTEVDPTERIFVDLM